MGDIFLERMIKKKMDTKSYLIMAGIGIAALIAVWAAFFIVFPLTGMPVIALLVAVGAIYGGYKLITQINLEYEYSFTNGFVSVDKIINRASRKRLLSFECASAQEIGEYTKNKAKLDGQSFQTKLFACEYSDGTGAWYMVVKGNKEAGRTLFVFNSDDEFLDAIKNAIPRPLKFEVFGRN